MHDLRPDRSRAYGIDANLIRRQIQGHAARHGGEGGLQGIVGDELRLGDEAGHGGDVDNGPAACLAHQGHHVLGDQSRPHDIDVQNLPPFLRRGVDALEHKDGGVVHQDVDAAEDARCLGGHALNAGFISHIGPDKMGTTAGPSNMLSRLLAGFRILLGNDDGRPFLGEQLADGPSDAVAAACHDRDFVFEPIHGGFSRFGE